MSTPTTLSLISESGDRTPAPARFSPLDRHCWDLSEIFVNASYFNDLPTVTNLQNAADWLRFASGVIAVTLDTAAFDNTFGLCEPADDYFRRKDIVCSAVAKALTRFLYIWASFESLIDSYCSQNQIRKAGGKVKIAAAILKTHIRSHNEFSGYLESLESLYQLLKLDDDEHRLIDSFNNLRAEDIPSAGLTLVYSLRNSFAHGSFEFPEPPDDIDEKRPTIHSVAVIDISSRLILLSIQMLVWALAPADLEIDVPDRLRNYELDEEKASLGFLMKTSHFCYRHREEEDQQAFDFQ